MKIVKFEKLLAQLPSEIKPYVLGKTLIDTSSHSGALVIKVGSEYYLKIDQTGALKDEAKNVSWFYQAGLGIALIAYVSSDKDYLLTKAAYGQSALAFMDQPKLLCQTLANALKKLHQYSPVDFPITDRLEHYQATAEQNYKAGAFYDKALLPYFAITDREDAHQLIISKGHLLRNDAFIHGDACLPNIILKDTQTFSCFIDVGLAGVSDRHIDLFWVIWSLHYNLGTDQYTDYFLDAYGREMVDFERLQLVAAYETFG